MSSTAYARRPRSRSAPIPTLACLAALAAAGWTVLNRPHGQGAGPAAPVERGTNLTAQEKRTRAELAWVLDPAPVLGSATARGFVRDLPVLALDTVEPAALRTSLVAEAPPTTPAHATPAPVARALATLAPATLAPATPRLRVASADPDLVPAVVPTVVPLPVPRPAGLTADARPTATPAAPNPVQAPSPARVAARRAQPATRDVFRAAIAEEPSFLERLFGGAPASTAQGGSQGSTPALAYADPDAVAASRPRLGPSASASPSEGVAVYDISASTVTLPSGEVLEAHSGYGDLMDDPRYVHVRMRGATPPGTYDMTERGTLFHGVRAIRLTPFGGSAAIHGRDGILAHTYMLRAQPGASNGCVVFRDYDRFLRAFLRGEVRRLIVVAGQRSARMDVATRGGR